MVIKASSFNSILLLIFFLTVICCVRGQEYDRFGGYMDVQLEATGHFRVDKISGRWVYVTPEGHPYVALGGNHVGKFLDNEAHSKSYLARFKGNRKLAEDAIYEAMTSMGLNAGEAYAPLLPSLTELMPYVVNIDFPDRKKFRFDVFDLEFKKTLERKIAADCTGIAKDSMVLGIAFADLPVWDSRRMDFYRSLPNDALGKKYYQEFLREKYVKIARLNKAYQTDFLSFEALDSLNTENLSVAEDDLEFLGIVADSLYADLKRSVRKHAPGKLFFGERFVLRMAPKTVLRSVGKHVDVFCTQALILSPQRPPEWQVFQKEAYSEQYKLTGQRPMMVIDWAAPFSLDTTYETERGTVKNEREASEETSEWLRGVFSLPYVIGVFKCQLIGTHGNDRWFPKGRMKRTYLRDDGRPFAVRTEMTKEAHEEVLSNVYKSVDSERKSN